MVFKKGYDYSDYPTMNLEVVDDGEGEASIEISGVETECGHGGDYGATVILRDRKIVGFRIKSYEIELEIPATSKAHTAILKALHP